MKNMKFILVFTLIIAFLLVLVTNVQATNDNPLPIFNINTPGNNTENANNTENPTNNVENAVPNISNNEQANTNAANTDLPQTGIAEDTALFVFIAVCVVSAIYAFIKIRNYKNV